MPVNKSWGGGKSPENSAFRDRLVLEFEFHDINLGSSFALLPFHKHAAVLSTVLNSVQMLTMKNGAEKLGLSFAKSCTIPGVK